MDFKVLDKGFIKVLGIFGDDLVVTNSARVSFGKQKTVFDDKDERLIKYLIENKHMSPIRQVMIRLHIKSPEFVMRQLYKHVVGIEACSTHATNLHSFNEISGRYVMLDEFYVPNEWRLQSKDNKQGSADDKISDEKNKECSELYQQTIDTIMTNYHKLVDEHGVAKELARTLLPLSIYTESIWTMSLQALLNFIDLRTHPHAQYEIRQYAYIMEDIVKDNFPIVYKYWQLNNKI
jgi:thymidylate synthase (FAD)